MAANQGPLVNAPAGYIWRWRTYRVAHVVRLHRARYWQRPWARGMCGSRVQGEYSVSTQVGGYSAKPCADCVAWIAEGADGC